jgi:hypothetical protein
VYPRTERLVTIVAFFIAIAIVLIAILKIDKHRNEQHKTAAPQASTTYTASPIASPPPTARSETSVTTAKPVAPTPTLPPPPTPTPPPVVATTPVAPLPGASPMPHTGGGAVPQGIALVLGAAVAAVVARHTDARSSARSSTG